MCLPKESESPESRPAEESPQSPQSPRSPWAKLLNRQNLKPRLPRNISTRVNLNKYWSKLGELMGGCKAQGSEPAPLVLPFSDIFQPTDPVKPAAEVANNEANVNIFRGNRFEIIPQDGIEITENLANEVREICYSNITRNCSVCSMCG